MKLIQGEQIKCPHCGEPQEGTVEDYVIPGRTGMASAATEQCGDCDEYFSVVKDTDGTFDVAEADKP